MVILGKVSTPLPAAIPNINRKSWLKILGITLDSENVPDNCISIRNRPLRYGRIKTWVVLTNFD